MKAALAEEISTEAIWFGYGGEVTIATRLETPVNKAPSVVTVITDEEIKNLGYRTFVEILRTVPGFEILKEAGTGVVEPAVRGIASASKVKVMLNGHTVNTTLTGSAFGRFDDFPVENIKKLEIIRGPGSAMYGENAFTAVINIITKDAADIDGVRISSGYGSFDTYEENVVFGERVGKVEVSGMVHYRQTTVFDGEVESDFQTIFDSLFGSNASLAPGRVHDGRQEYDLNLKIAYEGLWLQGWYSNKNRDPFIGGNLALKAFRAPSFYEMFRTGSGNKDLDPETIMTYEVELSYKFNKHVTSSVSYFYNNIDDLIFLKRGQDTPVYENLTDAHVQGVEMETRVDIIRDNYIFMNYTFQSPEDNHGNDMPFVAQHHGNFGVNVHYPKYINTNLSAFVSGTRSRVDDDTRDNLPAYALLNLSVIGKEFFKTLEIQGTVFNMLDKDYSDPGAIFIPKDLPRPGRTYFVGLSYQF
ncbi:MAG: TonB-dependent receptor [Candidatus Brocadia sp.]|nr:TonB-dependent receptor [Candidatus Brocadia sp.]